MEWGRENKSTYRGEEGEGKGVERRKNEGEGREEVNGDVDVGIWLRGDTGK